MYIENKPYYLSIISTKSQELITTLKRLALKLYTH